MKKTLCIALLGALCLTAFARGKQPVAFSSLPEVLQSEMLKNFTADQVQLITGQKVAPHLYKYVFSLADGTRLEYNQKAQLREVENIKGIRDVFVPENIIQYVQKTFPNASITKYKMESMKQEIELNDKMSLVFSKKGKFLRIDD